MYACKLGLSPHKQSINFVKESSEYSRPVGTLGFKMRAGPPYPCVSLKAIKLGGFSEFRKRVVPCRCLDGHIKEPYDKSMVLGARP